MAPIVGILCLLAGAAAASDAAPPPSGYVVKAESGSVVIDLGAQSGATVGQGFEVYSEGEELKHPVTGASLGRMETVLARGTVSDVRPKFSVGSLSSSTGELKAGLRARLGRAAAEAPKPSAAGPDSAGWESRQPRWKGPPLNYQIAGMAVADFDGNGRLDLATADERTVRLYPYQPQEDKPLASYSQPGTAPKIFSLAAADLNGNGRAELFATLYNGTFERVETAVLELSTEGAKPEWKLLATIPWLVRAYRDASGKAALAVQQLADDATFPFSGIYPISCQDGRYGPAKGALGLKRVDWLYDFALADFGGSAPAVLSLTKTNYLRVQLEKGSWKTPESYGQTPARLRWPRGNNRLLEFHPPIEVSYDPQKRAAVYLVHNISVLGSLSEPFGLFNGGEIHRRSWDGVSLKPDWKANLGGYSPALTLAGEPPQKDLVVAVVGSAGKSAVWIYDP